MKKIKILLLTFILSLSLTSCGNMSMGVGNYTFEHIHFSDFAGNSGCATVEKWYDNSEGIEVKTREYGPLYFSEGTYVLVEDSNNYPFCKES